MKKLFCMLLCVALLLTLTVPAKAALNYTYIDSISSTLTFDDFWGVANCSGTVDSLDDSLMEIEVTLQINGDNGWEDLKTWTSTGTYCVNAGGSWAVARGEQYRLYVTAYVYNEAGRIVESGTQTQTKYF